MYVGHNSIKLEVIICAEYVHKISKYLKLNKMCLDNLLIKPEIKKEITKDLN